MTKECKICGKFFEASSNNQKYCSKNCREIGSSQVRNAYSKSERGREVYQTILQNRKNKRENRMDHKGMTLVEIDGESVYLRLTSFPSSKECERAHNFCFGCPYHDCIK